MGCFETTCSLFNLLFSFSVLAQHNNHNDDDDDNNNNNNNRDFTISSMYRELSPANTPKWPGRNRVQITRNTWNAYRVQHVVRRDSSAIKFDSV